MRREALATLTIITLLAGCIAVPEEVETAAASIDSPLLASLAAFPGVASAAGDAIVLRAVASPEGGTTAFWWEIPDGVILSERNHERVEFLAAPVLLEADRAALERWMVMGFVAKDGELALNALAFGAPFQVGVGGLVGKVTEDVERSLEPFLFGVSGDLRAGERVGLVVSGVATRDVEMALVLLPLRESWDDDEELPDDTEEFLAHLDMARRVALAPAGSGGMHQVALYYEGNFGFGQTSILTGPVHVDGSTTSAFVASRRATTVWTEFPSGGYGAAAAGYAAQSATGTWAGSADAHGHVSKGSGPLVAFLGPVVNSWPSVVAMGEGDVGARTSLTVDAASLFTDGLFLVQVDLDTTLTRLLGLPALSMSGLSSEGRVAHHGNALTLESGGVTVRAVGVA